MVIEYGPLHYPSCIVWFYILNLCSRKFDNGGIKTRREMLGYKILLLSGVE